MKKLFTTLALLAAFAVVAPNAFAHGGVRASASHAGGGVHNSGSVHGGGVHYSNPGINHHAVNNYNHNSSYNYNSSYSYNRGYSYYYNYGNIYVGPRYGYPYGGYATPAPIIVLVTDYINGVPYVHYVTAYWNNAFGGWWYFDFYGNYCRAR